jgi:hypothetical protein
MNRRKQYLENVRLAEIQPMVMKGTTAAACLVTLRHTRCITTDNGSTG